MTRRPPRSCKRLKNIREKLEDLMPASCRFANVEVRIKAMRSDRGQEWLVPVPVCITQKNWKQWSS